MTKRNRLDMRIDPDLKEAAEIKAAEEGRTLSQVIRDYLKRYVRKRNTGD